MSPESQRGIVIDMMPLTWFMPDELVDIHVREWNSAYAITKLGTSAARILPTEIDPNIEAERKAQRSLLALMENSQTGSDTFGAMIGKIYPQNTGGEKSGSENWMAKRYGTAGDNITVSVTHESNTVTIITFFGTQRMYVQTLPGATMTEETVAVSTAQLIELCKDNMLIDTVADPNSSVAQLRLGASRLSGGDNGDVGTKSERLQEFLDKASTTAWHTIALSIDPEDDGYAQSRSVFRSWLRQLNNDKNEERHGVVAGLFSDENAGMDSDQIDVICQDAEWISSYWLGAENTVRLFAGRSAGASPNATTSSRTIQNVTNVRPVRTPRQQIDDDARGLQVIVEADDGTYQLQQDVNSFVSIVPDKNIQWRFNQTKRGINDTKTRWNTMWRTQHQSRTPRNDDGLIAIRGDVDHLLTRQESEGIMTDHDESKITVSYDPNDPRGAIADLRNIMYVNAIEHIRFNMGITWAG